MGRPEGLERLSENADLDLLVSWELRPELVPVYQNWSTRGSDGAHRWIVSFLQFLYFLILAAQPPPGASLILNFVVRFTCIFTSL